jgi:hypothetical protein
LSLPAGLPSAAKEALQIALGDPDRATKAMHRDLAISDPAAHLSPRDLQPPCYVIDLEQLWLGERAYFPVRHYRRL